MFLVVVVTTAGYTQTKEPSTSRKRSHRKDETREPDLMLTWEVLRSVYPTHTFHMEDNLVYRDIVATRNIIAQVRWCHQMATQTRASVAVAVFWLELFLDQRRSSREGQACGKGRELTCM